MGKRGRPALMLASIALLGFGAAGCGGQESGSGPNPAPRARAVSPGSTGAGKALHAGEACVGRSEWLYAARGLMCVAGRLRQASAGRYVVGQFCSGRAGSNYASSGLTCIEGRLAVKSLK